MSLFASSQIEPNARPHPVQNDGPCLSFQSIEVSYDGQESLRTRVELIKSVMGGSSDALLKGEVDLAISPQLSPGFLGASPDADTIDCGGACQSSLASSRSEFDLLGPASLLPFGGTGFRCQARSTCGNRRGGSALDGEPGRHVDPGSLHGIWLCLAAGGAYSLGIVGGDAPAVAVVGRWDARGDALPGSGQFGLCRSRDKTSGGDHQEVGRRGISIGTIRILSILMSNPPAPLLALHTVTYCRE
ncbi:hypothetical protein NNRS527_01408 [Nitrosospira sp. NRS527]|nr:hypothetical protein NNRS527_01408 [Nitrosospira sp. NRS527]